MDEQAVDVALAVRPCDWLEDWYAIERAEHDGRTWLEPCDDGHTLMHASRISDADVEGNAADMHALAEAIEARGAFSARRCAVRVEGERARLWSPRNSTRAALVPLAAADAVAAQIRATVPRD
jgi:hypothetical protein